MPQKQNRLVYVFVDLHAIFPMLGTWKWRPDDYKKPLVFQLNNVVAKLFLKVPRVEADTHDDLSVMLDGNLCIEYLEPSSRFIRGLQSSGKLSLETAKNIHGIYKIVMDQFEMLCRTVGGMEHYDLTWTVSLDDFYRLDGFDVQRVKWGFEGDKILRIFKPKIPRRRRKRSRLFQKRQLITIEKWKRMQEAIDKNTFPDDVIIEILRIQSLSAWKHRKVALLEISVLLETVLKQYAIGLLSEERGLSGKKLKDLEGEITFYTILNIALPLGLTKTQWEKLKKAFRPLMH